MQGEYDLRIQRISRPKPKPAHYRVFKRTTVSGTWKTNTGSARLEELPVTDKYRAWADAAATIFGGLDICTVDAIHCTDGKEYILEVNGTSSGFAPERWAEDSKIVAELVLSKMMDCFCPA